MNRRKVILLLGGAVMWPAKVHPQAPVPTVGFLSSRSPEESQHLVAAFLKGLGNKGLVEGKMSSSSIAGLRVTMIDCPLWLRN